MKLFSFTVCILITAMTYGQVESPFSKGAAFLGLGNAAAARAGHHSLFYNPAGIADEKTTSFSLQGARLYNASGVLHYHAGIILPSRKLGTLGVRISRYGVDDYNFQNYSVTYARKLFANFNLSASFNLYQFRIDKYGSAFVPNMEVGIITGLSDKLTLGVHIENPLPLEIAERSVFPTIFSAGVKYEVSKIVNISADIEKNIREQENYKVGVHYMIHPSLELRGGVNSSPASFYGGIGLKWKQLKIDLGNGYHQVLGNTTGLSVTYSLGKE